MNEQAKGFLEALKTRQLNVVTAESLTSGMIIATLVNIPLYGAYTYGGFSTYDSDAKRRMIGVEEGDVYTEITARQMAAGALVNSRALVSIAVTGEAGPVAKASLDTLGVVDAAVSIRTTSPHQDAPAAQTAEPKTLIFNTRYLHMTLCDGDGRPMTHAVCRQYRAEAKANAQGYVSGPILSLTRKLIRQNVVIEALKLAHQHIQGFTCKQEGKTVTCKSLSSLCTASYDGRYTAYGEPTWVIKEHSVVCAKGN